MDISNENEDADHESSQPPSQQPNGLQDEDPSGSQVESHPDTPVDGRPVSQPNSQPATQSNDIPKSQAIGHPGTQTPPSGQGNPMEEEPIDPKELLEPFGWDDLEERFAEKMEECQRQEAEIEQEFREWCQVISPFLLPLANLSSSPVPISVLIPVRKRKGSAIENIMWFLASKAALQR